MPAIGHHPSIHGCRKVASARKLRALAALKAGPHWSTEIRAGDGRWTLIATPLPGGPGTPNHYGAWLALLGGLCVTAAVAAYIWAAGRHSVVELRSANAQLLAQNERFDAALQN